MQAHIVSTQYGRSGFSTARRLQLALACTATALFCMAAAAGPALAATIYPSPYAQRPIDENTGNPTLPTSYSNSPVGMPMSWPQFKQQGGFSTSAAEYSTGGSAVDSASYTQADDATLSYIFGGAFSTDYLDLLTSVSPSPGEPWQATGVDPGTQLRGYLLGDSYNASEATAGTNEPPTGESYFLFSTGLGTLSSTSIASWVAPLFNIENIDNGTSPLSGTTIDDTGTYTAPEGFTQTGFATDATPVATPTGAVNNEYLEAAAVSGTAATATATATWTVVAPVSGEIAVYANIPVNSAETRTSDAEYTVQDTTSGGPASVVRISQVQGGFVPVSLVEQTGGVVTNAGDTITVTLDNSTAIAGNVGDMVLADAIQLRVNAVQVVDNTDPPITSGTAPFQLPTGTWTANSTTDTNFYGSDYLTAPAVARNTSVVGNGASATATWTFTSEFNGPYDVDVWFPSQNGTTSGGVFTPDVHISDAEYTVTITDSTGLNTLYTATTTMSQVNGGYFQKVFGPLYIPSGDIVTLQLDNTTNDTAPSSSGGSVLLPNSIVVADAAEITPDNGEVAGQPLAVNVSDYPELQVGQGGPVPANTPAGDTGPAPGTDSLGNTLPGGLPLAYKTTPLNFSTGIQSQGTTSNPYEYYGYYGAGAALPSGAATGSTLVPIGQVTYFARTENDPFTVGSTSGGNTSTALAPAGPASQTGAMYCVDGLTGNVIWKYGASSDTIDTSDTNNFAANSTPWGTAQTAPDTNIYGASYLVTEASTTNNGLTPTALVPYSTASDSYPTAGSSGTDAFWQLPLVGSTTSASSYFIYEWVPTPNTSDTYYRIHDAQFTVETYQAGSAAPVAVTASVDQTLGGQWVELINSTTANGSFLLGANNSVQLSNAETATDPATSAQQPGVVADAIMFVPVDGMGTVAGTPVLVRQMRVNTWAPGEYGTTAATPQTRDCLIFADNLGRIYCVDAAGNGDGDDTILDEDDNVVSFNASGTPFNAATNQYYSPPYNFHVRHYGTTTVYWIWQPSNLPSAINAIPASPATGDTGVAAGVSLPSRDMPIPSAFEMNSPTVALSGVSQMTSATSYGYDATLYIGNPNGVLYSIDATDGAAAAITGGTVPPQWVASVDATTPQPGVYWWYQSSGSISYAPAYDAKDGYNGDGLVLVTTYDPNNDNIGHLFAVDALYGPVGDDGAGPQGLTAYNAHYPGSPNYNVQAVPYWSFPDAFGPISGLSTNYHLTTSLTSFPSWPLGDMPGTPAVETIQNDGATHILIAADDPNQPGGVMEPATYGRVYSISPTGNFEWAFPETGGDPNSVTQTSTNFDNVYQANMAVYPSGTTDAGQTVDRIYPFATTEPNLGVEASSSVATALITFPTNTNLPAAEQNIYGNERVPMAYVGNLGGDMLALNLDAAPTGTDPISEDAARLVYNEPVTPNAILSTPVVLAGSASAEGATDTNGIETGGAADDPTEPVAAGSTEVGGTLFFTAANDQIIQLEATPYTFGGSTVVNEDWAYTAPGALSSPSIASFNVNLYSSTSPYVNSGYSSSLPSSDDNPAGTSEWVYCGSDDGFVYGFSPNTSSGGGFSPGIYIPPASFAPPGGAVNLLRIMLTAISTVAQTDPSFSSNYTNSAEVLVPPANPVYDWGQTAYIQFYGIDDPSPTDSTYPKACGLQFTLSQIGTNGQVVNSSPQLGDSGGNGATATFLGRTSTATNIPVSSYPAGALPSTGEWVYTYPAPIANMTPGTSMVVTGISYWVQESPSASPTLVPIAIANNRVVVVAGSEEGLNAPPQITFTVLNPLALSAAVPTITQGRSGAYTYQQIGPLSGFSPGTTNFAAPGGWQYAGGNGNNYPLVLPQGGWPPATYGVDNGPQDGQLNVAVGLGYVKDGTSGDNGTGVSGDAPYSPASAPQEYFGGDLITQSGQTYGSSMLLIADRSALGTEGNSISNLRAYIGNSPDISGAMTSSSNTASGGLGWIDNTNENGPGSVINPLSWDTMPASVGSGSFNSSPDYPNIPASALSVVLQARSASESDSGTTATAPYPNGVSAQLLSQIGTLAPSDAGTAGQGDQGSSSPTRTIYPNNVLVQLNVPKYQPANLETLTPPYTPSSPETTSSGAQPGVTQNTHTALQYPTNEYDTPEGYQGTLNLYIDPNAGNPNEVPAFSPSDAYRAVNIDAGVPVDMNMSIDQPVIDLGNVTPGYGNQVQSTASGAGVPFAPIDSNSTATIPPIGSLTESPVFSGNFQPITVRNNGNVNLLNVHFAQQFAGPGVITTDPANGIYPPFMSLLSDQNALVGGLFDPSNAGAEPYDNPSNWLDSLSFIPSVDNSGYIDGPGLLTDYNPNGTYSTNGYSQYIVRTSIDPDIYTANPNEQDLTGASGSGRSVNNVTLHKQDVGATSGSTLSVPDEPGSSSNPATDSTTGSLTLPLSPLVGVAIPMGTPVGDYSGTLFAFEGTDPYPNGTTGTTYNNGFASPDSGFSGLYTGPQYYLATHAGQTALPALAAEYEDDAALAMGVNDQPLQYYTSPAATLKVRVVESRMTDGAPMTANDQVTSSQIDDLALPNLDSSPLAATVALPTGISSSEVSDDFQPFAFRTTLDGGADGYPFGLLFVSDRTPNSETRPQGTYDLWSSVLAGAASPQSALSTPTNPATSGVGSWWSPPVDVTSTPNSGEVGWAGAARSPFVLTNYYTSGTSAPQLTAFWVQTSQPQAAGRQSSYYGTTYTICMDGINEINSGSGMGFSVTPTATSSSLTVPSDIVIYTGTDPVYALTAFEFNDAAGGPHTIVMWHTRKAGRSSIQYIVDPSTSTQSVPQTLPVATGLVNVTNPSPVLRVIDKVSSGAFTPYDPDPSGVISSSRVETPQYANYVDITYSGTSSDGSTDIYTSRYQLAASSATPGVGYTLVRVPVIPQNNLPASTGGAPGPATMVTETLIRSNTDHSLYYAPDVDWDADPTMISVTVTTPSNSSGITYINAGGASAYESGTPIYSYDQASGVMTYPINDLSALTNISGSTSPPALPGEIFINPSLGTVKFSVQPSVAPITVTASFVPMTERITNHSMVNVQPQVVLDDQPDIPEEASSVGLASPSGTVGDYVRVGREWYVYRKSGTGAGNSAATVSTLYYDTRRLTVDLAAMDPSRATTSMLMDSGANGGVVMDASNLHVYVGDTEAAAMGQAIDVTNRVDFDPVRARVYFPAYMEGLYAYITFKNQAGTSVAIPSSAATPVLIAWTDEAYVNAQNPSQISMGERTVPILTAVNESNPCLFLDPTAGITRTSGGANLIVPHRMWLFWASERNAASAGSDIYYEALDPRFDPVIP